MELKDKRVLVVGFERTGRAAARFLAGRGARVLVTDRRPAEAFGREVRAFAGLGVSFELGGHRPGAFLEADLIVPSPGVPPLPELLAARSKGVPVLSEIELAFRFLRGRIVGVTGSNGKSTTSTLIHRILREGGLEAFLAGNIGTPLVSFADRSRDGHVYVTEVSSFQLEYTERFTPAVAAVLNVSENHLDWHGSFERYFEAKKKLVLRQGPEGLAVLNRDDARVWGLAAEARSRVFGFSPTRRPARGAFLDGGWVVFRDGGRPERVLPVSRVPLPGAHNLENVLAAALVGRLLSVPAAAVRRAVAGFRGLEHRLEDVGTFGGVRFVNDSKATTVAATLRALASFDAQPNPQALLVDATPLGRWLQGAGLLFAPQQGRLNDSRVRLREAPHLEAKTLGYLEKGQLVQVLERSGARVRLQGMEAYWYRVQTAEGAVGWAYGQYIDLIGPG